MRSTPNHRLGLLLVCASVLLVSAAQLLLKIAVMNFHEVRDVNIIVAQMPLNILGPLCGGFACYGISVLIWQRALSELPLSIAYPMLSLSYPLVYIAALLLPGFTEVINPQRIAGLLCVLLGIALLAPRGNSLPAPRENASSPRSTNEREH